MYENELYHHGVQGQKWGVRRYQNEDGSYKNGADGRYNDKVAAKAAYKSATKAYKQTAKEASSGFGIKGIAKAQKAASELDSKRTKYIDAKAQYAASKKSNEKKAEKAEFKTYVKEFKKNGLAGSYGDQMSGGQSTKLYQHLTETKGKEYADKVQKRTQNTLIAELAGATAVLVGTTVAEAYLASKYDY